MSGSAGLLPQVSVIAVGGASQADALQETQTEGD